ncbi:MAG: hypothetical protein GY863_09435 [bacterium]|nr:hypothetical protein [bacterium]
MWKILRSEIEYNKWMAVAAFLMISMFIWYKNWTGTDNDLNFFYFLMPFLILNSVVPIRFKEKRDQKNIMLPVTSRTVGASRIMLIFIPAILIYVMFYLLNSIFSQLETINPGTYILCFNLIIFIYSMFFIFYDLFNSLRKVNFLRYKKAVAIGIFALVLLLALNIFLFKSGLPESYSKPIINVIDSIINSDRTGLTRFSVMTLFMAAASVLTYTNRKSFLDKT